MEIKEQIERDLKYWKASEKKHHGDGNTYLAGICQGSIDAYTTALNYFNQSSNVCNCPQGSLCEFFKDDESCQYGKI
jgi:hypothetical protein